jgi:hypothetical protein
MALRDQPYLPLYIQDYLTDEKLNECSAASQGVYIKILCVLHKSDEYGKFLLKQNDKQTTKQTKNFALKFARHITFTPDTIESALDELVENSVMTLNGDILFQKRMVKDNEISLKRSNSGKKGGEKTQFATKFAKAKTQANSEDEIEYENDNEIKKNKLSIFEQFYQSYPKKKSRGQAEKAFLKINPDEQLLAVILEAVERAKKSDEWIKEKGKYIPHPATWLNAKGWLDEDCEAHPLSGVVSDKTIRTVQMLDDWRPPA